MLAQRAAPKLVCAAYAECKIFINEAQKLQEDYCRTALLLQEVYQSALGTANEQFEELQQLFSQFARISFHLNEDYDKVHEYLWFRQADCVSSIMSQREHKLSFKQLRQYLLNGYEVLMKTRAPESMRKPLVLFFK